jgi:hypothetical protein
MAPTTAVHISAAAPAHQTSGGKSWVQLRLDPEPDAEWRRLFKVQKGIDRCELPESGAILSVGHDGIEDLKKRLTTIEAAIGDTNKSYLDAIAMHQRARAEANAEVAEIADFLLKKYPPTPPEDEL